MSKLDRRWGLLASSSLAALLIGGWAPAAFAAPAPVGTCSINDVGVSVGAVSNSAAIDCINILNSTVTGDVTNAGAGIITTTNTTTPSRTGILIDNSTINGAIVNNGTIHASSSGGAGILVDNNAFVTGGISNSGTISGSVGIIQVSSFSGGISNSGTISVAHGSAVFADFITSFSGGISNSGTISGGGGVGVNQDHTFSGGIDNSGKITVNTEGIFVGAGISSFSGGISNSGMISSGGRGIFVEDVVSNFSGGISNIGTISAASVGIDIGPISVTTFAGGISNSGMISAGKTGILVESVSSFSGDIGNSGTISAANFGIIAVLVGSFSGGISNSKTISAGQTGIVVFGGAFSGGVSNSGTISAAKGNGIFVTDVTQFGSNGPGGGVSNSGVISVGSVGIKIADVLTFSGGVGNAGAISSGGNGIQVGNVGSFSSGISNAGAISAGGFFGVAVSEVTNFSGGISNSGTIALSAKTSAGIDIGSVGSFSGGISNAGAISAGVGGILVSTITSFSGGVSNSGTIVSMRSVGIGIGAPSLGAAAGIATFAGNISNSGTISAMTGIVIAPGVSFAPGGAIVNSDTIIGADAAINVSNATSPVTIDQTGGLISGAIKLSTNADVVNISGGAIAGDIVGAGASDTINFALGSGTFTYGGGFGFSTINQVNVNSGTVILDGANSAANVTVNSGILEVGDASNPAATLTLTGASPLDVVGGALAGHGAVVGNVAIANGATLSPGGGSIGALTISGNLAMSSGSFYSVELSPTQASMTQVNGSATLGGATVRANADLQTAGFGFHAGQTYTILTATNVLGSGNVFNPDVTLMETSAEKIVGAGAPSLSYDANDVFLTLPNFTETLSLAANAPLNAQNVAGTLNNFIDVGATLPSGFQSLANLSGPALNNAANQLAGQVQGGFAPVGFEAGSQFLNLMLDPYIEGRSGLGAGAGSGSGPAPLGYADEPAAGPAAKAISARAPEPRALDPLLSMWASAYGDAGSISGNAATGAASANSQIYGFATGLDYRAAPNTTVGLALGGGGTSWQLGDGMGSGHSGMFQAGVYGTTHNGPAYVSGAAAYSLQDVTTNRAVALDSSDMQGSFDANVLSARIEGGYRLANGPLAVTPYGALEAQAMFMPSYGESSASGSPFALDYAGRAFNTTRTELGAWFDTDSLAALLPWTAQGLKLYSRLAWAHDFDNEGVSAASFESLPGSGTFLVNSVRPARDSALVTAGFEYRFADGWSALAKFDGQFSATTTLFAGSATLRKVW